MIEKPSDGLKNETATRQETIETLHPIYLAIYPIFKQEVYNRRGAMMQIARNGMLVFVSLSVFSVLLSGGRFIHPMLKGIACGGIWLVTLLLIDQIRQEKSRHEQAKRQLILLEQQLRFFEPGAYLSGGPLYPLQWQERPAIDRGLVIAIAGLVATAALLLFTLLLV